MLENYSFDREKLLSMKDIADETERCKDPVYFFNNYWKRKDGHPMTLSDVDIAILRGEIVFERRARRRLGGMVFVPVFKPKEDA